MRMHVSRRAKHNVYLRQEWENLWAAYILPREFQLKGFLLQKKLLVLEDIIFLCLYLSGCGGDINFMSGLQQRTWDPVAQRSKTL